MPPHNDIQTIMAIILAAVSFCRAHTKTSPLKKLLITLALSHHKKEAQSTDAQLGPTQVNTGFTTCAGGICTIVIYRREEWFKVLLHECMHAVHVEPSADIAHMLDRTIGDRIKVHGFSFAEAYVEFWARVVNCAFAVILHGYSKREQHNVMLEEQKYAKSLIPAVLRTYDLTLTSLFTREKPYITEKSNVVAYYVIASILLTNYVKVLEACGVDSRADYLSFPAERTQYFLHLVLTRKLRVGKNAKRLRPGLSLAMTTIRAIE